MFTAPGRGECGFYRRRARFWGGFLCLRRRLIWLGEKAIAKRFTLRQIQVCIGFALKLRACRLENNLKSGKVESKATFVGKSHIKYLFVVVLQRCCKLLFKAFFDCDVDSPFA